MFILHLSVFTRATLCQRGICYGPVSVSVSDKSRCSIETDGRIKLDGGTDATFNLSYNVMRKFRYLQNKLTSFWNFVLNSGLRKFIHGMSYSTSRLCCQISLTKTNARILNNRPYTQLSSVELKLTILATVDVQPTNLAMQFITASVHRCYIARSSSSSCGSICNS